MNIGIFILIDNNDNGQQKLTDRNMGLVIALGAGVGVIFGQFIFGSVGVGICVCLGVSFLIHRFSKIK